MMRVLLMEINQESNSFCPVFSVLEDYRRCCFYEGGDLCENIRGTQLALGGMIQALEEDGVEIVPGLAMRANAGGILSDETLEFFIDKLREYVEKAGKLDGCYISFHGATQSQSHEDVCGYVLQEARRLLGKDVVIATSYDLHADVTPRILELADIVCGYWTYPHVDQFNTGYRAAKLGNRLLKGEKLYMAYGFLPMIQPASGYTTEAGELQRVMRGLLKKVEDGTLLDVSAFQMQPWLDVSCGGSSIVAIGHDKATAEETVRQALPEMWAIRHAMRPKLVTVEQVIEAARQHEDGKPVVVSDFADSPNAGAAGDNFDIAAALMEKAPDLKVGTIINDTELVDKAFAAGVGGSFRGTVGGTRDKLCSKAYPGEFHVESLHTGDYVIEGPAMRYVSEHIGPTATLRMGNVALVACVGMATTGDPQLLRHFGVEPTLHDVVIVKACTSYRTPYGKFAGKMLTLDTGCSATADLTYLPFKQLPKDFYPFTDNEHPHQLDEVFCK